MDGMTNTRFDFPTQNLWPFTLHKSHVTLNANLKQHGNLFQSIIFLLLVRRLRCNQGNGTTPLYVNVNMDSGETANTWMDALSASFAGVQVKINLQWDSSSFLKLQQRLIHLHSHAHATNVYLKNVSLAALFSLQLEKLFLLIKLCNDI